MGRSTSKAAALGMLLASLAVRGDGAGIAPAPPGTYTLQHILSAPDHGRYGLLDLHHVRVTS